MMRRVWPILVVVVSMPATVIALAWLISPAPGWELIRIWIGLSVLMNTFRIIGEEWASKAPRDPKAAEITALGHCPVCYFEGGLRVVNDPGHNHIPYFISQARQEGS